MEQIIHATVLGARRFDINGDKIGSMFISQPVPKDTPDYVGHEVMKVSCPFPMIDEIRFQNIPGDYQLRVKMKTAAGGKVGLEVLGLKPVDSAATGKPK